jgi:hypothetical protein
MKHTLLREINQDMASRSALSTFQTLAHDPARIHGGNWQTQYDGWIEPTQVAEPALKHAAQFATGLDAALAALGVAHARSRDWRGISILLGIVAVAAWLYALLTPFSPG